MTGLSQTPAQAANIRVNPAGRHVARATPPGRMPGRPAGYAERWADKDHDERGGCGSNPLCHEHNSAGGG